MNGWQYLLYVNLYITLFYGFYVLFLKKETFFQLNRLYLLGGLAASFFIPMVQTSWVNRLAITQQVKYAFIAKAVNIYADTTTENDFNWINLLVILYVAGVVFLLIRLAIRLFALKRLITTPDTSLPFSFFRKIYIGNGPAFAIINDHENIHANQWHSADVMLMEVLTIINWFNPVIYFYTRSLKSLHEFIADEGALRSAPSKADYALLLLSQTFETPINNLVNPFFNRTLLKQRIMMIQKNRSRKAALVKYLLLAPLVVVMLILSSATVKKTSAMLTNSPLADTTKKYQVTIVKSPAPNTNKNYQGAVFTSVENEPTYPGGLQKLYAFLQQNIKYPAQMRQKKVEGKVYVSFIVEKDGSLNELKVLHEPGYGSGQEALRVLGISPKWTPGVQNGHKVRVQYVLPINFSLKG